MNDVIFNIVYIAITVLAAIVVRFLVPFIVSKMDKTKYEVLVEIIGKAMECVESTYGEGKGDAKFNVVFNFAQNWIHRHNVNITDEQIRVIIEGVFRELDGYTLNTDKEKEEGSD